MRLPRPAVIWLLAPALGVFAVWGVTFAGVILGGLIELDRKHCPVLGGELPGTGGPR